eukprot:scaffold43901_cov298-Isochrysis_galbana.AAC.2
MGHQKSKEHEEHAHTAPVPVPAAQGPAASPSASTRTRPHDPPAVRTRCKHHAHSTENEGRTYTSSDVHAHHTQHHRPTSHGDQSTRKDTGLEAGPRVWLDGGGGAGVLLAAGASGKGAGPVGSSHCDSPVCSLT